MKINSVAMSLTVEDVKASSDFLRKHFAFKEKWSADGFVYLVHENFDVPIIFIETGKEVLPKVIRDQKASGVIVAFVVDDIEAEEKRLKAEGVVISAPLQEDPWGERLFEVTDPNGVVFQIVQWVVPADEQYWNNNPGQQ